MLGLGARARLLLRPRLRRAVGIVGRTGARRGGLTARLQRRGVSGTSVGVFGSWVGTRADAILIDERRGRGVATGMGHA